jgi:hypothetical protein
MSMKRLRPPEAGGRNPTCLQPSSAVEQTAGHLRKVFGTPTEQDGIPHRRYINFPQRLFDVEEAPIAPHGTNKHLRILFKVRDCVVDGPICLGLPWVKTSDASCGKRMAGA